MQTRRQFVTSAGSAAAAAVFAPQALAAGLSSAKKAPMLRGGRFSDGLMSGDPTPNGITLLTRIDDVERSGGVLLEVARDRSFKNVVTRKTIRTSADLNHSVKARVTGLKAYEQYYYRFATSSEDSDIGRFRTGLPADSRQTLRFAFYSCQDFTHGYYNAHEIMAKGDYDFVVCLGDYIYAESYHSKNGTKTAVRDDKIGRANPQNESVVREAVTLADYRAKYSLYRSDKSLQKVQAKFPTILLWDDHEVQDNYAGAEKDGGLPAGKHFSAKRRAAAEKAFFENQPLYAPKGTKRTYRSLKFGKTLDMIVMDQRQYRANQPCNDAVAPACEGYDSPRDLLGRKQMDWVKNGLKSSTAAWKVMANQVTIMPTKVLGGNYFTFDTWQGYPQEREELLGFIQSNAIKDVVFLTGDIHTFITGDVRTKGGEGDTVALEFVGGSITSQNLGETDIDAGGGVVIKGNDANPKTDPGIISALRSINPWVDQADFDHHGFGKATVSQTEFDVDMVRVQSIKKKSTAVVGGQDYRYKVQRGQTSIKGVHGPPA